MAQVLKMLYRPHRQVEEFKQMKRREEKLDGRLLAKWDFASGDELAEEEEEEEEEDDDEDDEDEADDEVEQDEEDEISGNVSGS